MLNANSERRQATGVMKRSTAGANLIGKGTLGAFKVRDAKGREFTVGTGVGLTDSLRRQIWDRQSEWAGKTITIKHKPHGEKLLPRSPVYVGVREKGY